MPDPTIGQIATQVTDRALVILQGGGDVIIRAHAGAGKTGGRSSGTIRMAAAVARTGARVALIVAQRDQVVETLARLTATWPDLTTTFVPAASSFRTMPDWVRRRQSRPRNLVIAESGTPARAALASRAGLFVMTAAKFSFLASAAAPVANRALTLVSPFDVVIVDETWMMPTAMWLRLSRLSRQVALIGDPAQILPWLPDSEFYPGMRGSPAEPLPDLVCRERPGTAVLELAVSRRSPSHTTAITGRLPAYAANPTRPMYDAAEVPIVFGATPLRPSSADAALARMATQGVALERLPAGLAPQDDPLLAGACARAAARLLSLGAMLGHPAGGRPLVPRQLAILVAHHDQKAAVVRALAVAGLFGPSAPHVATFNAIQGATVAVSVVWHPLSGRADISGFHADAGRLTVGLTRHTHGCLLISRDGIGERLAGAAASDDLEGDAVDHRFAGLRAHELIWTQLAA